MHRHDAREFSDAAASPAPAGVLPDIGNPADRGGPVTSSLISTASVGDMADRRKSATWNAPATRKKHKCGWRPLLFGMAKTIDIRLPVDCPTA
ncbi:hypothetical protein [Azospirillum endophyticum]